MARLHEHQGKALLADRGIAVPHGIVARTPEEARAAAERLGGDPVIKIQAWTTGRAAIGGVALADSPDDARAHAQRMLAMTVGAFPITELLVEERIDIARELFVSCIIDDTARAPAILLGLEGGSGIEERAGTVHRIPASVEGVDADALAAALRGSTIDPARHADIADAVHAVFRTARDTEARSVEVNPLVITADDRIMAADCRIAIDDYAVFRHPELGIDIARELDHPPTPLERIAYAVEQADHRGTFYFCELPRETGHTVIGFHGAGGGGSMMSMDAVTREGFTLANFCDTSGNPSAAKVYAAARIILAQPGIAGYFGSGSGVASQEQYWSAYGLAKAFREMTLAIPAVIRLGGNGEDRAVEILEDTCRDLPAPVEGYRKDDTPASIAARFRTLVGTPRSGDTTMTRAVPGFVGSPAAASYPLAAGTLWIDVQRCDSTATAVAVRAAGGVLEERDGVPVPAVPPDDLASRDSECIAAEIECARAGRPVIFVDIPILGLDTAPGGAGARGAA